MVRYEYVCRSKADDGAVQQRPTQTCRLAGPTTRLTLNSSVQSSESNNIDSTMYYVQHYCTVSFLLSVLRMYIELSPLLTHVFQILLRKAKSRFVVCITITITNTWSLTARNTTTDTGNLFWEDENP